MHDDRLKATIIETMSRVLNVPADRIADDSSPETIKEWDSLRHMSLILALEEELGVRFGADDIPSLVSARSIFDCLSTTAVVAEE
jgi:acyl carrier protein